MGMPMVKKEESYKFWIIKNIKTKQCQKPTQTNIQLSQQNALNHTHQPWVKTKGFAKVSNFDMNIISI